MVLLTLTDIYFQRGHTQNSNESFNSTIWRLALKHLSGAKIIEIAAFVAACAFNKGSGVLKIMQLLKINNGQHRNIFVNNYDEQRVAGQEQRRLSSTKKARTARRLQLTR
ncbi:hypothetical protein ALC57_14229 [Trachymyrmex cornetzi]|uniref:Uncharacterized protein n=1 Tax=Trachymyrmex cornetzi TaxID=471704 RepID=A0A195DM04_9HYME|nr:hypothetical protein ALC57_14229 [Trachymyrmex cornetzi]